MSEQTAVEKLSELGLGSLSSDYEECDRRKRYERLLTAESAKDGKGVHAQPMLQNLREAW